jgi:glycosyltransferase involved in cell wall biosynthesis
LSRVLWIVQDGVLSGPGASQTIPYLCGLARCGHRLSLLSFEREQFQQDRERVESVRERLLAAGISWTALPFGSGQAVPRTLTQLCRAVGTGRGLSRGVDFIHARSYVPALIADVLGRPFLFDMRGLWPREKVDAGIWREGGPVHRTWQSLERRLLNQAAGVVLLAQGAKEHLPELHVPTKVIPTAVDLDRFRPDLPPPAGAVGLAGKRVFAICGALGSWYLLPEMLDLCALAIRTGRADHVLILSEEDRAPAVSGLLERGVSPDDFTDRGVPHDQAPLWFSLASAGILLIRSAPSKRASTPTKLAEFLACGVPVVTTPGIGDTEELLTSTRTGVIVRSNGATGHEAALRELEALGQDRVGSGQDLVGSCHDRVGLAKRCRDTAAERLSLDGAVSEYSDLYAMLMERIT